MLNAYIKCGGLSAGEMVKYVPQAHAGSAGVAMGQSQAQGGQQTTPWKGWLALSGVGQEGFLGFLLFWIGGYALIHGELFFIAWSAGSFTCSLREVMRGG